MNVLAAQIEKEKKSKKAYSKLNDSFLLSITQKKNKKLNEKTLFFM